MIDICDIYDIIYIILLTSLYTKGHDMRKQVYMFIFCLFFISKPTQAGPFSAFGVYVGAKFSFWMSDMRERQEGRVVRINGVERPVPQLTENERRIRNEVRELGAKAAVVAAFVSPTP